jgi:hypothetical protein
MEMWHTGVSSKTQFASQTSRKNAQVTRFDSYENQRFLLENYRDKSAPASYNVFQHILLPPFETQLQEGNPFGSLHPHACCSTSTPVLVTQNHQKLHPVNAVSTALFH